VVTTAYEGVSNYVTKESKTSVMHVIGSLCVTTGSSTVQLHSRCACTCSEAGFTSQNGDHASVQRIFIKKWFLFTVGSVCRMKWFTTGSRNRHLGHKHFADDKEVERRCGKWPRQQSKDFYAVGF
jgi:hypothetical protein